MKPLLGLFLMSWCYTCFGCGRGQGKLDVDVFIVTRGAKAKQNLVELFRKNQLPNSLPKSLPDTPE
jgi:hypothetical protein